MASYYSGWVATDDWRIRADVSVSTSNTAATYTVALYLENRYANVRNTPFYGSVTIAGTASNWNRTGVYPGNTYHLGTAKKTVNKGTTSKTVAISFRGYFGSGSSSAAYRNGTSGTASQTLAAKPSYTVSYNANGGSGAPGNQTKWYGETLKLSSTKPSRTGHSFQGWATSSGGSVAYASGASYTANAAVTLYAVWKANTYAVKYNANGGTGAPGQQTKTYGVTLKLSSTKPTRTNYNFKGWATSATGAVAYQPGGSFTTNATTTLYAVWQLAYVKPRITNLNADRCNSAGTLAEDGQYAKVTFNWATDRSIAVGAVIITCNGTNYTASGTSGTSGSVSHVVGANALSTEYSYTITVKVTDSGGSTSSSTTLPPLDYIIDFSPQGGIGIGTVALNSERVDINRTTYVNDHDLEVINGSFRARGGSGLYGPTYVHGEVVQDYNVGGIQFRNSSGNAFVFARNSTVTQGSIVIESPLIVANRTDQRRNIDLSNNAAITGKTTSGSAVSLLRMNTSNQVELNWTSGGLKGRVMKQIWSGTWSSGSITVSELPYYNVLVVAFGQVGGNESTERGILFRSSNSAPSQKFRGGAISASGTTDYLWIAAFSFTPNGTKLTWENSHQIGFSGVSGNTQKNLSVRKIWGLL